MLNPTADSHDDQPEACGENDCHCYCVTRHGPCGCDCPRTNDYGNWTLTDEGR